MVESVKPSPEEVTVFLEDAKTGNCAALEKFIDRYPEDINNKGNGPWTALMLAAARGQVNAIRLLAGNGADMETTCHLGRTALIWAAMNGEVEVTMVLLEKGASIHERDNAGKTAEEYARRRHPQIATLLKNHAEKLVEEARKKFLAETDCNRGLEQEIAAPKRIQVRASRGRAL